LCFAGWVGGGGGVAGGELDDVVRVRVGVCEMTILTS
jgi:hypothetical protein